MTSTLKFALVLGCAVLAAQQAPAAERPSRVGVYDSCVLAYAYFWSAPSQKEHAALYARAKAAKDAGDRAMYDQLASTIRASQKRAHLQVFSTAPASEALSALNDRLPAIEKELGVHRLVSRWDDGAMRDVPAADRVDATDRLVREFLPAPTDRQRRTIAAMRNGKPLPLWEVKLVSLFGGI